MTALTANLVEVAGGKIQSHLHVVSLFPLLVEPKGDIEFATLLQLTGPSQFCLKLSPCLLVLGREQRKESYSIQNSKEYIVCRTGNEDNERTFSKASIVAPGLVFSEECSSEVGF